MSAFNLLVVGPALRSNGSVTQFLTGQNLHLPPSIDVRVHHVGPTDEAFTENRLSPMESTLRRFARLIDRDPPDVAHVHASSRLSFYRAAVYVLYAVNVWDAGVVLHVHESSFDDFLETSNPLTRRIQSVVFEACDSVIVLSEHWRKAFDGRVDEEKLHVVPNGVDVDEHDPAQIFDRQPATHNKVRGDGGMLEQADEDTPTVTFVSDHAPRKRIVELVEAINRLKQTDAPPFEVRIAGDGPAADEVESLAERYENIEYLGEISEDENRALLADSSIYALPSHADGLPTSLLEGMATGNAVVTTTAGSIPEVVDEDNGRLVSPGDVEQLTDALRWLIENPADVRQMKERNRRLVRQKYSWDAVVDRLVPIYNSIAPKATVPEAGDR